MFTGIIESLGQVIQVTEKGGNRTFTLEASLATELKVDQSLAHNGVCLTVESIHQSQYTVTAIAETLLKSNLADWQAGTAVNLERSLAMQGRLDGHLVQGHVDATGVCTERIDKDGSWEYRIEFPETFADLVIEKGSICLNGISLTIFNVSKSAFTVAIIPYTFEHTNMHQLFSGNRVNLEFDLLGKYVQRMIRLRQPV